MTATLKDLDEVLAKHDCDEGYDNEGSDFLSRNRAEIRAALELKARVDAGDVIVPRENIERGIEMARVFDDGSDGADAESAARVVSILSAMLEAPPAQESNDG